MDPPQCVQNAMMTKDKKPFTYTPGGIDLSEVKSPRMQRRIERNANLGGVETPLPPPQSQYNVANLPPSALAAMRPQTQVQVFPGPPPPPPMSKNIPPPPPPPSCPLPTQKVTTFDNQVVERPDMTKIIPENPMALLRKTAGPAPRKSIVDQMFEEQNTQAPLPPQRNFEAQSPRYPNQPAPVSPPVQQQRAPQQQYQPAPQQYQPPSPPQQQYQPQPQYQPQSQQFQQRSTDSPKPAGYYPPIIERPSAVPAATKNVSSNVGTLYIPPRPQQNVATPPTPPERQPEAQSPGTPTLKEAPRPWQQKNQQQEVPAWARKDEPEQAPRQNRWQPQGASQAPPLQPPPRQVQQQFSPRPGQPINSFPVHIEIRSTTSPQPADNNPNAVYVTQPVVMQHPGNLIEPPYKGPPRVQPQQYQQTTRQVVQQQQQRVETSGTRIIPIQIEGRTTPSAGNERAYNRQQSWGTQPTQSNAFKVIQKFTRTDDDEDDTTPVTQHSPRYPQEMPEQVRRMKINDNNGNFRGPQNNHQAEGNGQPQPYIHPSEQVVPEPKKYMGGNIPSRTFKILQAMTAPSESSANANYNEEVPPYNPYNPYPYYHPLPYWPNYYGPYYEQQSEIDDKGQKAGRSTPLPQRPYWPEYYDDQNDNSAAAPPAMPPPYWGYAPPPPPYARPKSEDLSYRYPPYPPYFDPYYYGYYYGYTPMMPPYPYYHPGKENEENSGYSSMDEMAGYNLNRRSSMKRRNSLENSSGSVNALRHHFEVRSKSATPRIIVTTPVQENVEFMSKCLKQESDADSTETEVEEEEVVEDTPGMLRSMRSVQNLNTYTTSSELMEELDTTESEETSEEDTDDEIIIHNENETIPHQLSVIFEESERGESRRSFRCNSVMSETTTIAEHQSEEEEEDFLANQNVQYKIKLFQENREDIKKESDIQEEAIKEATHTEEDWWSVLKSDDVETDSPIVVETEKKAEELVKIESSKTVTVEVDGESFSVKLRDKPGRRRNVQQIVDDPIEDIFATAPQRNSIYDILKTEDDDDLEIVSGGTLMRVDSFANQLEAIKRNSGLFNSEDIAYKPKNIIKEESFDSDGDIKTQTDEIVEEDTKDDEVDFWSQIKTDEDEFKPRRRSYYLVDEDEDPQVDSTNSCESSSSKSQTEVNKIEEEPVREKTKSTSLEPQTIKDRIEAWKNSIAEKGSKNTVDERVHSRMEVPSESRTSAKSSIKSFEEYSEEEELDSGVISDISRHISDNEEFPELKKLTRYERAATHSRLFRLLQDECDYEEEYEEVKKEEKFSKLSIRQKQENKLSPSKSKLSLSLTKCDEESSINEKLVEELVQSLLKSKKAQVFKNMPKEKLYSAAVQILQEGIESGETPEEFSSLLSPLRDDTQSSTPAQTPQEFYGEAEYKQYYETWREATVEIMPSKAFKLLQEHIIGANKLGSIEGVLAKCPRVLSSKRIETDCSSPLPQNDPNSNDVTNT